MNKGDNKCEISFYNKLKDEEAGYEENEINKLCMCGSTWSVHIGGLRQFG